MTGSSFLGSELSPIFIGLSAHSGIQNRRLPQSPGFRPGRGAPWCGTRAARAPHPLNAAIAVALARLLEANDAGRSSRSEVPSQERVTPTIRSTHDPADTKAHGCQEHPRSAVSGPGSSSQGLILPPEIPGRAKRSSARQLAVSPNSRAEPQSEWPSPTPSTSLFRKP